MKLTVLGRLPKIHVILLLYIAISVALGVGVAMVPYLAMVATVLVFCVMALVAIPARHIALVAAGIIIVLVTVLPLETSRTLLRFGSTSGAVMLAAIALSLAVVVMIRSTFRSLNAQSFFLLAMAFVGIYMLATLANEPANLFSLVPHAALWTSAAVLGLNMPRTQVKPLLMLIVLIAAAEAGIGLAEVFLGITPPLSSFGPDYGAGLLGSVNGVPRAQGTFGHPIPFAAFLTASLPTVWWLWPRTTDRLSISRLPLFTLLVGGVLVSFSRSSWLALMVLVAAFLASRRADLRDRWLLVASLICSIAVLSATDLSEIVNGRLERISQSGSYLQRFASLSSIPAILGTGLFHVLLGNGFNSRFALYDQGILQNVGNFQAIDNQFVSLLVDAGVLGLGIFIIIVFMTWSRLRSIEHRFPPTSSTARVAAVIRYTLLPLLMTGFFFENLLWPSNAVLLWLLIGLAISYTRTEQKP